MKRLILILTAALLAVSCFQDEAQTFPVATRPVSKVELSRTSLSLTLGQAVNLSASVSPWNAEDKKVVWASSAPEIVSVSESGMVQAVAEGEADITATAGGVSAVCHVVSSVLFIPVEALSVTAPNAVLAIGASATIEVELSPENTTQELSWASSDPSVARVSDGVVTGVAPGYADITATAGDFSWTGTFLVHGALWLEQIDALIKPYAGEKYPFHRDTLRVARGETATLQALVYTTADQAALHPSVTQFAPKGQTGVVLEPKVWWVRDVTATEHWDGWCGGAPPDCAPHNLREIPDALMPPEDYEVWIDGRKNTALWVDIDIPRDFAPGIYDGILQVASNDVGILPFTVQVYDVTLPEKQGLDVLMWQNREVEAMAAGESIEMYSILSDYMPKIVSFASEYGQTGFRLLYADSYTVRSSSARQRPDGTWEAVINFSEAYFQREFDLYGTWCKDLREVQGNNLVAARNASEGTVTVNGFQLDDAGELVLDGSGNPVNIYVDFPTEPALYPCVKVRMKAYFDGLREMLESHTLPDGRLWKDVYVQTIFDEPNDDLAAAYNDLAAIIREVAPDFKLMEPIQSDKVDLNLLDYPVLDPWTSEKTHAPAGSRQWLYTAMGPQGNWANRFIRIPLLKTRILHWLNYSYDTWGYLHWGLNYWVGAPNGNPWRDANGSFLAGDMWIIWPGDHKVYPSIRLCAMRDGIHDFDLLRMIEERSKADADAFCARLVLDSGAPLYNMDLEDFRQLRREMLEYLEP